MFLLHFTVIYHHIVSVWWAHYIMVTHGLFSRSDHTCPFRYLAVKGTSWVSFFLSHGCLPRGKPAAMSSGCTGTLWTGLCGREMRSPSCSQIAAEACRQPHEVEVFKWLQSQLTASPQPPERPWARTNQLSHTQESMAITVAKHLNNSWTWWPVWKGFL